MKILLLLCLVASGSLLSAQDAVRPGRFIVGHPTLLNLGFQWFIEGDHDRDAAVSVRYRAQGASTWQEALPLLRIGGERVYRVRVNELQPGDYFRFDYVVPHGFAGSILNLEPGTEYECEFTLTDPDGVDGSAVHVVKVRTRTEPQPARGGRVLHVYPPGYQGPRLEPSFNGIMNAYYGAGLGDWSVVWPRRAQPGDTLLLHAGLYRVDRSNYVDPMMAPFDGTLSLTLKGTPEQPITLKAAGDGEVIIDGGGGHTLFDVMGTAHHIFEGLTFRHADVVFQAGRKELAGAVALTVRNCRFENIGVGVWTEYAGSRDFYIADNLFLGRGDRMRLVGVGTVAVPYGPAPLKSYFAVKVYGPGHVICHNAIAYFHDGVCISTYGAPEPDPERQASSIDIHHNDFHLLNDDFVETDGGVHNIRVFNNRGVNASDGGYSAQPVFGGPAYFYRNLLYHQPTGFTLKFTARPAGLFVFHNTIISELIMRDPSSNIHYRNNLFIGRDTPGRGVMGWAQGTAQHSSDYNGFRPNRGIDRQYAWLVEPAGNSSYEPRPGDWTYFRTLAEFRAATGQEMHGIEVDLDIFESMRPSDPARRNAVYHAMDLNFRLNPRGAAVDAGTPLPTINDGYAGKAPDLGALEAGQPEPRYGPRWLTWTPFYR